MQHVHFSACGCSDERQGNLDLYSLNESISRLSIECLNEKHPNSIRDVITDYEHRFTDTYLTPDSDNEVIVRFTFKEEVRLKGLLLSSKFKSKTPQLCKLYLNQTEIDFSNIANYKPTQEIKLQWDPTCEKPVLFRPNMVFNNVSSITLYVANCLEPNYTEEEEHKTSSQISDTDDQFALNFIGFLGNFTGGNKGAVKALYEAAPVAGDHPVHEISQSSLGFGL